MPNPPDIDGFEDAQERLVSFLGADVMFEYAETPVFASGAYIDPETNKPLDPVISPSAVTYIPVDVVKATPIKDNIRLSQQGLEVRGGLVEEGNIWLRIPEGTYPSAILSAKEFTVYGDKYRIERIFVDGIGADADRLMMEGSLIDPTYEVGTIPSGGLGSGITGATGALLKEDFVAGSATTSLNTSVPYFPNSTLVYLDGLLLQEGVSSAVADYNEGGGTLITFFFTPMVGQNITVAYRAA